ncbi:hypothetical protein GLAREA_12865 [Glarea lozoyensis ATCC 20868]|uniref:Indole-diterpene biosynthesis protein PaxU n=1 Tax=Glarea lozoyensis (strain ATCC 20868 / MF5171) TaxID=1116229 RepID=S3CUR1_GLAL2|nr:uncharacterized protein GLAREA_12865 [Glarea lozoyensis ATCC 20868]EPE30142.1 hypothetical protein GLAREA_12865 [Glarea lozoyensis ATCC 20868]
MTSQKPFHNAVRLSETTYLFQPNLWSKDAPTFILSTWMNAAPKNILFYVESYQRLFPTSRVFVLIGTVSNMVYRLESRQKISLQPVMHALLEETLGPLFLHAFSNSGAQQLGLLLRTYKEITGGKKLNVDGLILDSTPSRGEFSRAFVGLSYQVPSQHWYIRYPGVGLVLLVVTIGWLVEKLTGKVNVLSQFNADMNDRSLFGKDTFKQYMYSKEDLLVSWEDIEWHADMAESKGWRVGRALFEKSGHCRHGKGLGEERYWNIINSIVAKEATDGSRQSKL